MARSTRRFQAGADGSAPPCGREHARRAFAALAALALAAGCAAGAVPPPGRRAPEQATARAAAEAAAREATGFVGVYAARPADGVAPARAVTLLLRADGGAQLDSVLLGRGIDTWRGRWSALGDDLRVEWAPVPPGTAPAPMAWRRAGAKLAPIEWDPGLWGASGPGLARWAPSRAAHPGCAWRPFADPMLGLRMLVEACDATGHHFAARGAEIVDTSDATAGARGTPVVQVFAKGPKQALPDAIRKRFFPQLVPRVRKGCVVRRGGGPDLGDPGKQVYTIGPTKQYRKETEKWRAAEPTAMVCGPYGERDGIGYFEFHPKASPGRYLFVWLGREAPRFDERSIELLD